MRDDSPLQETDKLPPTSAQDAHTLPDKGRWRLGGCNELSVLSQAAHPGPWVLFVCSICGDPVCTDPMGDFCFKMGFGEGTRSSNIILWMDDVKNQRDMRANVAL